MVYNVTSVTNTASLPLRVNWAGSGAGAFQIQRSESASGPWAALKNEVPGTTTMVSPFVDGGVVANRKYYYRLFGVGGGGTVVGPVYTRLAAPSALIVTRPDATHLIVDASDVSSHAELFILKDAGVEVTRGLVSSLPATVNLGFEAHSLTMQVSRILTPPTTENTNLTSADSPVLAVGEVAPPLSPTNLSPDGPSFSTGDISRVFSWRHNPSDATAQTSAEAQVSPDGVTWSAFFSATGAGMSKTVPLPPAGSYLWRVRTKGLHGLYGAYSAPAAFTILSRPVGGIVTPGSGSTWASPVASVAWSTTQAQGFPQTSYIIELCDYDDNLIESHSGSGADTAWTFKTRLEDGGGYAYRVQTSHNGVVSEWSYSHFYVSFPVPALPILSAAWDEENGVTAVSVSLGAGGAAPTANMTLERTFDQISWELVADPPGLAFSVNDAECRSNGSTWYRASAWSADGAVASRVVESVADSDAIWLSTGAAFAVIARLPFNPGLEFEPGRERATRRYEGRSMPVPYAGDGVSMSVKVSGSIREQDDPEHVSAGVAVLKQIAQYPAAVFLVRDWQGRRIYGSLPSIPMPRERAGIWAYSFSLEETSR